MQKTNNSLSKLIKEVLNLSDILGVTKVLDEIEAIKTRNINPPYIVQLVLTEVIRHFKITKTEFVIQKELKPKSTDINSSRIAFILILSDKVGLARNHVAPALNCSKPYYHKLLRQGRELEERLKQDKELIDSINEITKCLEKHIDFKIL